MPAHLSAAERAPLIEEYAEGAARLRAAWSRVPDEARQWRKGAGHWSAHEVVVHCGDSETYAATRIRLLVSEPEPLIVGYDQDRWASAFDYHSCSPELALDAVEAVRANTVPLLRRLDEAAWAKIGRHTESGAYGACDWLLSYAAHVTQHARQIERNIEAFRTSAHSR